MVGSVLELTVVGAHGLKDKESFTNQDPYCVIEYGKQRFRTKTDKDGGTNPGFNATFQINITPGLEELVIVIWNENTFKDDIIGSLRLNLRSVLTSGYSDARHPVFDKKQKQHGSLHVIMKYLPVFQQRGVPPPAHAPHPYPPAPGAYPPPAHAAYPPAPAPAPHAAPPHQPYPPTGHAAPPPASSVAAAAAVGAAAGAAAAAAHAPSAPPAAHYPPPAAHAAPPAAHYPPPAAHGSYPPQHYPPQGYPPQQHYPPPAGYPPAPYAYPPNPYPQQHYPPAPAYVGGHYGHPPASVVVHHGGHGHHHYKHKGYKRKGFFKSKGFFK